MENKNIDIVLSLQDDAAVTIEKQIKENVEDNNERYWQLLKNESEE